MAIQKEGGRGSPGDSKPWRSPYNVEQPPAAYFWGRNSSSSTGGREERSETPTEVKCLRTCVLQFQLAFNSTKMPEDSSLVLTLLRVSIYKQLKAYPSLLISQELRARDAQKNVFGTFCEGVVRVLSIPKLPYQKKMFL